VKVTARFYNANGDFLATEYTYTYLTKTEAGAVNPFKLYLTNPPAGITRIDWEITYNLSSFLDYRPATIVSQQVRDNYGPEVDGDVRNDQVRELRSVVVAVTFYNGSGSVVYTASGYPSSLNLAPGATSTYKVSTFQQGLSYASYTVQAQGYLAA